MEVQAVVKSEPNRALTQTYVKPLTLQEQITVDVLTHRYKGISDLFEKVEDETSITVSIPRLTRVFGSRV